VGFFDGSGVGVGVPVAVAVLVTPPVAVVVGVRIAAPFPVEELLVWLAVVLVLAVAVGTFERTTDAENETEATLVSDVVGIWVKVDDRVATTVLDAVLAGPSIRTTTVFDTVPENTSRSSWCAPLRREIWYPFVSCVLAIENIFIPETTCFSSTKILVKGGLYWARTAYLVLSAWTQLV
jgi:hypothetical protein